MPSRAGNHVICEHLSSRYLQYLKLRTICRKRPLPELDGSMRMRVLKLWLAWADAEAPVSPSALQATLNVRNVANSTFKAALARLVTRSKPKSSSFFYAVANLVACRNVHGQRDSQRCGRTFRFHIRTCHFSNPCLVNVVLKALSLNGSP